MATRTLTVAAGEAGQDLVGWLARKLGLPPDEARRLLRSRRVRVAGAPCSNPAWKLRAGQKVEVPGEPGGETSPRRRPELGGETSPRRRPELGGETSPRRRPELGGETSPRPPGSAPTGPRPAIKFLDRHIVVVDKPTGLTTMRHAEEAAEFGRGRRFLPKTLQDALPALIAEREGGTPVPVIAVHRIDKETSGLVVFARTLAAEKHLGGQFRSHAMERRYTALARGEARDGRIESWIVRDRGDGRRGSGPEGEGQHAVTHVTLTERLGAFSLVECRLETGRTHQVRIHLGEAGTPLCGETIYDRPRHGRPHPDGSGCERIALHAATLGLTHPETGAALTWSSPLPADLARVLKRLRQGT